MKIKVLFPIVCLTLLFAVPQAEAQSKRQERKLRKEMRKLEKQMKKVQELKQVSFFPMMEEMEVRKALELSKVREYKQLSREFGEKQREMALEQAEHAREIAEQFREQNSERIQEYRELARENQQEARENVRRAFEGQRREMKILREHYPDRIRLDEIELPDFEFPDFDIELPDIDFEFPDFPEKGFKYKYSKANAPQVYKGLAYTFESDNNLSIKTNLDHESIDKTYEFTVADDASYLNLRANGSVSEGSVTIEIKTPQDKEYQSIELSTAADVDWSQKVKITDEKRENLKGKWKIRVKGDNVKGHFGLSLRSK